MKPNELQTALQRLSRLDLYLTLWYVRARWLRHKIAALHPGHLLIPTTVLQIIVFVFAVSHIQRFIYIFAIGNFILVWLATLPLMFQPHPVKAHWVK